jgi:hypothetical protein
MLLPACTGFGDALFVTVNSPPVVVPTTVLAVALLFAVFGSLAEELAEAVSLITVPFATPVLTFTTILKLAVVEPAIFELVQTMLPVVAPTPGPVQFQPVGGVNDTRDVFAGIAATKVALSAALGPLLVSTCV